MTAVVQIYFILSKSVCFEWNLIDICFEAPIANEPVENPFYFIHRNLN